MVQAPLARGLEPARDLAHDAAGLFGGQRTPGEEGGQGQCTLHPFLNEVGLAVLAADIQDADEPGVLDPGGSPSGVQDAGPVGVLGINDGQSDCACQCRVVGGPALDIASLGEAAAQEVATSEDRSWAYPLHPGSFICPHQQSVPYPYLIYSRLACGSPS